MNNRQAISRSTHTRVATTVKGIALALFLGACGNDGSGPTEVALRKLTLEAVSARSFSADVGTVFGGRPSVRVKDEKGHPVHGVPVEFAVNGGAGIAIGAVPPNGPGLSYSSVVVTSNADGIASLGTWRLPNQPGMTTVSATAPGAEAMVFTALAVTGPPATLSKFAGDGQFIPALEAAVVRPQILVTDYYMNPVVGVPVTFSVVSGGGTVTGADTYTNAAGIAVVGSWTVGASGVQSLAVTVEGFDRQEVFTASIANSTIACGALATLPLQQTVQVALSAESCSGDGMYYDVFTVNLGSGAYRFTMDSPGFDSRIELLNAQNATIGVSNNQLKVIVPGGVYKLRVSSRTPGKTGSYSIRYATSQEVVTGCEEVFVERGLSVYQTSGSTDCAGMSDRFGIYLKAGHALLVNVEDLSYSDHKLVLFDSDGQAVGSGAPAGQWWIIIMNFVPKADGIYYLDVSSADDGAEYTLNIR